MKFRSRLRALERLVERRFGITPGLKPPRICTVYVDSKAPSLNPGPIRWGSVDGMAEIFERGPDESEDAFIGRLQQHLPDGQPRGGYSVTIHAESMKPEPPEPPAA